jgi:hypothetical protein
MNWNFSRAALAMALALCGAEVAIGEDIYQEIYIKCSPERVYRSKSQSNILGEARKLLPVMKEYPLETDSPFVKGRYYKIVKRGSAQEKFVLWRTFNKDKGTYGLFFDPMCGGDYDCIIENSYLLLKNRLNFARKDHDELKIDRNSGAYTHNIYYEIDGRSSSDGEKLLSGWTVFKSLEEGRCEVSENMETQVIETRKF